MNRLQPLHLMALLCIELLVLGLLLPWPNWNSLETVAKTTPQKLFDREKIQQKLQSFSADEISLDSSQLESLHYFETQLAVKTKTTHVKAIKAPEGFKLAGRVGERGIFISSPQGKKSWVELGGEFEGWKLVEIHSEAAYLLQGSARWKLEW